MILLIDNYDSFTWNLYQALARNGQEVQVHRNDAMTPEAFIDLNPEAVVISPGPGHPKDAGSTPQVIAKLPERMPLLGVCLGHQALCEHYGATLEIDPVPIHGKTSPVHHEQSQLMQGLENPLSVGRYHSIRARRSSIPDCLRVTAWTQDDVVMAVEHQTLPRFGLQFHPESILTPQGQVMLDNFLTVAKQARSPR